MTTPPFHFSDSYRTFDWISQIEGAENSIVICVYYWDKWVKSYSKELKTFLQKPNSTLQFIFSNALDEVQRLFPKHSLSELQHKIDQTYQPLKIQFPEKVKVATVPHPLNYSMQCFDDSTLILSFYEMFRTSPVDSPAVQIDLRQNPNTRKFYEKELKSLISFNI